MTILLATSNPHKLGEIQAIFRHEAGSAGALPRLLTLADLDAPELPEPVEDGDTFEANALKKARHYAEPAEMLCLADDSGLEVDALGGEPGVRSARYAGAEGPRHEIDLANNRLLLERLEGVPADQRTARFVCAMALVAPPGLSVEGLDEPVVVRGTVEGRILLPEETDDPTQPEHGRGSNGFGYDPLFLVPSLGRTTAELDPAHKNALSHRGNAARQMFAQLRRLGLVGEV